MKSRLVAITGPLEGQVFALERLPFTLGRQSGSDLQLRQAAVSRRHCEIIENDGSLLLHDLDSSHGCFVNGQRVGRHALCHGDYLKIGDSVLLFLSDSVAEGGSRIPDGTDFYAESTVNIAAPTAPHPLSGELLASLIRTGEAARQLRTLLEVSSAIHVRRGVAELAGEVARLVRAAVPAERAVVALVDHGDGEVLRADPEVADEPRPSRALLERVMASGEAVLSNDVLQSADLGRLESLRVERIRSLICAPFLLPRRCLGALYVDCRKPDAAPFTDAHLRLLSAVAAIAAAALDNARQVEWLSAENRRLAAGDEDCGMVGESPALRSTIQMVARVAPTDSTVLLLGESGTGKELAARAIHAGSDRDDQSFVAINCATLTGELLASELFGHEKGSFTGADRRRLGKFEVASGGTLFLDEIGELPLELQARLLRALEERRIERIGGNDSVAVDIRVIAATNRDLAQAVRRGAFREDLYYRLNVISLSLPPLRERREDILPLAMHFVHRYRGKARRQIAGISPAAQASLMAYSWPGNARELANAIERAMVLGEDELIQQEDLPEPVLEQPAPADGGEPESYRDAINGFKRRLILQTLAETRGNVTQAARRLELQRNYLHRLIERFELKDEHTAIKRQAADS